MGIVERIAASSFYDGEIRDWRASATPGNAADARVRLSQMCKACSNRSRPTRLGLPFEIAAQDRGNA
jgi:hypothetical protein